MQLLNEFKAFILRGNVVDLAVGLIIGAAFTGVVTSLVNDILMPPIGAMMHGVNFSDLAVELPGKVPTPETKDKPSAEQVFIPVKIAYGKFLQAVINFLIVGACLFFVIKGMNTLVRKKKEEPKPAELTPTEKLLTEIRDALQQKS
jgi:large conductance mechanosensitive channel